jgi:hypothetical protein
MSGIGPSDLHNHSGEEETYYSAEENSAEEETESSESEGTFYSLSTAQPTPTEPSIPLPPLQAAIPLSSSAPLEPPSSHSALRRPSSGSSSSKSSTLPLPPRSSDRPPATPLPRTDSPLPISRADFTSPRRSESTSSSESPAPQRPPLPERNDTYRRLTDRAISSHQKPDSTQPLPTPVVPSSTLGSSSPVSNQREPKVSFFETALSQLPPNQRAGVQEGLSRKAIIPSSSQPNASRQGDQSRGEPSTSRLPVQSPLQKPVSANSPIQDERTRAAEADSDQQQAGSAGFKVPGMDNWQPARAPRKLQKKNPQGTPQTTTGTPQITTNSSPMQPRDTNNVRPNMLNRLGPEFNVRDFLLGANTASGGAEGEGLTGEANLLLAAQAVVLGTVIDGRNAVASQQKKNRYTKSLEEMLQEDRQKNPDFLMKSTSRPTTPDPSATPLTSTSQPTNQSANRPSASALTNGYDMKKVEEAAKSDDVNKAMRAKEILLKDHINREVATKQRNRAIYNTSRNAVGIVGGVTGAVATHGVAPAVAASVHAVSGLRAAGYTVGAVRSLDPGYIVRVNKQYLRNTKFKKVDDITQAEKAKFGAELKDNTYLSVGNDYFQAAIKADPEVIENFDPKTITKIKLFQEDSSRTDTQPGVSAPAEPGVLALTKEQTSRLLDRLHDAMQEKATRDVNDNMKFAYGLIPAKHINEKKNTDAKKQRHDLMADYGYDVVRDFIGANDPTKRAGFNQQLSDYANNYGNAQYHGLERLVQTDEGFANAYQLIRDMGGGKNESLEVLQKTMRIAVSKDFIETHRNQAAAAGLSEFDENKEKRTVTGALANMMARR